MPDLNGNIDRNTGENLTESSGAQRSQTKNQHGSSNKFYDAMGCCNTPGSHALPLHGTRHKPNEDIAESKPVTTQVLNARDKW